MPTQLELEAMHRQESSQHNAQIATTKVTRGKADIFDGKVPAGQLPTSTPPTPMFSEIVNLTTTESGSPYDFSQYENKTLNITITGAHEDQIEIVFPKICRIIIQPNVGWDGGWIQGVAPETYWTFFGSTSTYNVGFNTNIPASNTTTGYYIKFYEQIFGFLN
jgi:hypothetical protein